MSERVCARRGCENSLAGKALQAKYCSDACRQKDRYKREAKAKMYQDGDHDPKTVVHQAIEDAAVDIVRPIVREALTEEALRQVSSLMSDGLPNAIRALTEQVKDDSDPKLQQTAATAILKYTLGHQAVLKPDAEHNVGQMVVNFGLPRPTDVPVEQDETPAQIELKACDVCGVVQPATDFVASSNRCQSCHDQRKAEILARFS